MLVAENEFWISPGHLLYDEKDMKLGGGGHMFSYGKLGIACIVQ